MWSFNYSMCLVWFIVVKLNLCISDLQEAEDDTELCQTLPVDHPSGANHPLPQRADLLRQTKLVAGKLAMIRCQAFAAQIQFKFCDSFL